MRILGIDPGSRATGYGVVRLEGSQLQRLGGGVIRCPRGTLAERLARIDREVAEVLASFTPDVAALESVFTARNMRTALLLGHARGVALAACGRAGLEAAEYAPTQVKLAVVGYGAADKAQVQRMVQLLLSLPEAPPTDEADALALAICHAHTQGTLGRVEASDRTAARSHPPRVGR